MQSIISPLKLSTTLCLMKTVTWSLHKNYSTCAECFGTDSSWWLSLCRVFNGFDLLNSSQLSGLKALCYSWLPTLRKNRLHWIGSRFLHDLVATYNFIRCHNPEDPLLIFIITFVLEHWVGLCVTQLAGTERRIEELKTLPPTHCRKRTHFDRRISHTTVFVMRSEKLRNA